MLTYAETLFALEITSICTKYRLLTINSLPPIELGGWRVRLSLRGGSAFRDHHNDTPSILQRAISSAGVFSCVGYDQRSSILSI